MATPHPPVAGPILVVEDDAGTAALVKNRLAEAGWESAVVPTGEAAVAWLASHATPLLLLDHNLPDMTGEELVGQLNLAGVLPPFIVTTGAGSEQLAVALMKLGARDYLVKDATFLQSLQPAVTRVLKVVETEKQLAQAEIALRQSEDRYRRITEGLTDYQYRVHVEQGRAVATTHGPGCEAVTGYSVEAFADDPELWFSIIAPEDREAVREWVERILEGQEAEPLEHRLLRKDGSLRWVRDTAILNRAPSGALKSYDGVVQDITERKRADALLRAASLYSRNLIEASLDPMVTISPEGKITDVNRATETITGTTRDQLIGSDFADYFTDPEMARAGYLKAFSHGNVIDYPLVIRHRSGSNTEVLYNASIYCDEQGAVLGVLAVARDITERRSWEGQLMTLAHYDTLTQLPNRTFFLEAANLGIAHAKRNGKLCAILFVDLDAFKSVNDTLGHSVGDELLKDTAVRLASCIRETDMLARLGGDEFVILLNDLEGGRGALYFAERILETFNTSRMIARNDLFITVSMGIAVHPHDGDSLEELLKNADTAMYAAKDSGRNRYCFFDGIMNKRAITKMQVERGLRRALARKEFVLFYQPIVGMADGRVRGFEALLRWNKPGGEMVSPEAFIPIAEEAGLISAIGEWVLHEACRVGRRLADAGYPETVISVNVSVAQLRRKNVVDVIRSALDQSGLRPELLEIEVTESLCIDSLDAAVEILDAIRALGVQVCLDDFGTGYSSLVHLQKLPISTVKIDRLFIKEIDSNGDENAMIPAIISLAHKLRLGVVAEGVETGGQLEKLSGNGCDYCQGFLFSRPIPVEQVIPYLASVRPVGRL